MNATVGVLGGGVGGIVAANELRRRLSRQHRVVLIERNLTHVFAPSLLWVISGDRLPAQISRPLSTLLRPGIELVEASVDSIDPAGRTVQAGSKVLAFDYLVVALGAALAIDRIPGLAQAAHIFYTLEGAVSLRRALGDFHGGSVAIVVAGLPYKCPAAPHEAAFLITDQLLRRGLRQPSEVHLFTPEQQPMPVAGPQLGGAIRGMLTAHGVTFHPGMTLSAVDPQSKLLHFDGAQPVHYDLLAAIPPHRVPEVVRVSGLTDESGWIPVDPRTLATSYDSVYAIGDVTRLSIPGRWKPDVPLMLPKAGVFAHGQGEVVAKEIAAKISGGRTTAAFDGTGLCMLEIGGGQAGFAGGNFLAEPHPAIAMRPPGRMWHLGKVAFEQWWLSPPGARRALLATGLNLGAAVFGMPMRV